MKLNGISLIPSKLLYGGSEEQRKIRVNKLKRDAGLRLGWLLLTMLFLGACAADPAPPQPQSAAESEPHWTYEGAEGPEQWGALSPDFAICSTGENQSPINLTQAAPQDLANIVFHYSPSEIKILNNGHTIQVNYDPGSYIELEGKRYDLLQFHFHSPSEHTLDGRSFALETHLVHRAEDGQLAVVGILHEEGAGNAAFDAVWANLPEEESEEIATGAEVNAVDFLPANQTVYRYSGSLTTPPCSEGVVWSVLAMPVELSAAQTAVFSDIVGANNRPVQPLMERPLVVDVSP